MAHRLNMIERLTDMEVIQRYRFDKDGIQFLEQLLNPLIQPHTHRNHSLSSRDKILITLRYLATGPIQLNDADIHLVSQPTVSRVISEVIAALSSAAIVQQYIRFPVTMQELTSNQREFYGLARFPKVIGVIDGTHIRIKAPHIHEEEFVNRKGFHSINVQVAFDAFDKIIDLVARWPGSTHDSKILQESGLMQLFAGARMPAGQFHLLGDSGYPCKRWLLTPYQNPQQGAQSRYNRSHKITRAKVERGIGHLKRRFGVLHGEINLHPQKVCRVAMACGVLHNICKQRQIPMPDQEDEPNDDNENQNDNAQGEIRPARRDGLRYRDHVAETYF